MSEENKDLGDKAEEAFDKAKDTASDFAEEAKETAKEFSEGVKDTLNQDNKKILAGILAIILGGFGIHKFVLGYTKKGIIMLVATVVLGVLTCGVAGWVVWIIGLIEGIIYLTKSDEEFYNTYQVGKKPWF